MAEVGFFAKKIISAFCFPLGFSLLLIFGGLILAFRKPASRVRLVPIVIGAVSLLVMCFPISEFLLTRSLEAQAGHYADPEDLRRKGVEYVVVLSGSQVIADMTPADRWRCPILRVMEGVRLWKGIPGSRLVLSGGGSPASKSDAEAMAALPKELGVPESSLIFETRAWDTADEAKLLAEVVGDKPFALVTSARHLPRSMELFNKLGLQPIPCPCWFEATSRPEWYQWFLPDAEALRNAQYAIKEYLGWLWLRIRGVFSSSGFDDTLTERSEPQPNGSYHEWTRMNTNYFLLVPRLCLGTRAICANL
ncbi:MAG: ElyC/SanA/YdcF family protein [Pseudomonadota bacterium]